MNPGVGGLLAFVLALCYSSNGAFSVVSNCNHGRLSSDRMKCECDPCWKGIDCSERAQTSPNFPEAFTQVDLTGEHVEGGVVFTAKATDTDHCPSGNMEECSCTAVTYSITSDDLESVFRIDTITGEIVLNQQFAPLNKLYKLKIWATDGDGNFGGMDLHVDNKEFTGPGADPGLRFMPEMEDSSVDAQVPHHRQKRSVTLPSNATFNLVKYGSNMNEIEMKVGTRIQFRLEIVFPSGDTDMQVELFAPDTDKIVMMLCNVIVTKGDNLQVSGSFTPTLESQDNSVYKDHAIIALDTVTNSATDLTAEDPSKLTVEYEAVMIESATTDNDVEYWVSAGAEFNNKNDVWVGQASFTAKTIDDSASFTATPEFNLNGPSSLEIGSAAFYYLDVHLPYPIIDLKLDLFASVNVSDVMSICGGKLISVSDSYSCSIGDLWDYEAQMYADGNTDGYGRLHLDLGRPLNKLAREISNVTHHRLSFQFLVKMQNDVNAVGNPFVLGSSVQIGSSKIWAGQIQIIASAKTSGVSVTPSFTSSFPGGNEVSTTTPVDVLLDVDIPLSSSAEYTLEILAPFNDSQSVLQVCSVAVVSTGENLGCVNTNEIKAEFTKSDEAAMIPDRAVFSFGKITNVGDWGYNNPNTTKKNTIVLRLVFKGTNHSLATVGSDHDVIVGMYVESTRLVVGKITLRIGSSSAADPITPENTPSFSMSFLNGQNSILFGETFKFLLDIKTARKTIYSPMNIEFIMTNKSGEPLAHICKVEIHSSGKNTPCAAKGMVSGQVQLMKSFDESINDRAVLNLGSLCNLDLVNDTTEDHVIFAVSGLLIDHPVFDTNNKTWLSAGVMYSPSHLWVGQLAIYAKTAGTPPAASVAPHLAIVPQNTTITHTPHGYSARHLIRIKLGPSDTTPIKVNVTTKDNAVSVCDIKFVRAGDAYPCTLLDSKKSEVVEEDAAIGINKEVSFDVGMIGNLGTNTIQTTDDFDENTLELEMKSKMTIDTDLAPDNSPHELEVILYYDSSPEKSVTATVTLTATADASSVLSTADVNATSEIGSISGTNETLTSESTSSITFGESKRVLVSIDTEPLSDSHLSVTLTTPTAVADIMSVDYLGVYQAGNNLPCLKMKQTTATYEPRVSGGPHKDIGNLDLYFVCNTGRDTSDPTANTLIVEGVIRLDRDANVNIGDALEFHTSVVSNSQDLLVIKHTVTVTDPASFVDLYTINDTMAGIEGVINNGTSPITLKIGEVITIPLVFTVPQFSSVQVEADFRMPVNTSAIVTVNEIKFVASGRNLPDMDQFVDQYKIVKQSQYNTSQTTKIELKIGVISNAGMTSRSTDYTKWDDTFTIEVTLQMADHPLSVHDSTQKVSFGLDVSKFIYILDLDIKVSRDGSEELKFNVSSTLDEVNSTATRIEVDTMIAHDETSKREGFDTILNIFLPPYVHHIETILTSPHKEIISVDKDGNTITISLGNMFFTDEIYLTTVIGANTSFLVPPGISGSDSIFGFQAIADTSDQYNLTSELDYVNFTTTTVAQTGSSCSPSALGMVSGTITDCQISASRDSITDATNGRHTVGSGWTPFVHAGLVREERYFQVYFGHKTVVNSVSLQHSGNALAKKITIRHSDDGIAWVEDPTNEIVVDHLLPDQVLTVPEPVASRYIRVMITDTTSNTEKGSFKFEFTGCATTSDGPADLCTGYKEPTPMADFHSRSFLVADTTVYVCDGRKKNLGIEQRCYSTSDDQKWAELDPRVGSMLGYDSDEKRVYAVSSDGQYYMTSEDGSQWDTSVTDDVNNAKTLLTFKSAKKVPLDGNTNLNIASPHADYTDGSYGATNVGVKKSGNEVFRWSACC